MAHRWRRNIEICFFGRQNTGAGTNFSWLRSPKRPSSSNQAAMGLRLPWVSGKGARSRRVVHRAAGYSSRTATTPKCSAAVVTARRFASSIEA